jgi:hypothetical protein
VNKRRGDWWSTSYCIFPSDIPTPRHVKSIEIDLELGTLEMIWGSRGGATGGKTWEGMTHRRHRPARAVPAPTLLHRVPHVGSAETTPASPPQTRSVGGSKKCCKSVQVGFPVRTWTSDVTWRKDSSHTIQDQWMAPSTIGRPKGSVPFFCCYKEWLIYPWFEICSAPHFSQAVGGTS